MNPKKVLLLIIVGASVGLLGFAFVVDRYKVSAVETRVTELAGLVGSSSDFSTALGRAYWAGRMPGDARDYWIQVWKEENGMPGIQREVRSIVVKGDLFGRAVPEGPMKGGVEIETEWAVGDPQYERDGITYKMVFFDEDSYWKIGKIEEIEAKARKIPAAR